MTPDDRTLLADFLGAAPTSPPTRFLLVGFVYTAIAAILTLLFGLPGAGIFVVFLSAAALAGPLDSILIDNREAIWTTGQRPWKANRRTAACLLALFIGMVIAFAGLAIWLGHAEVIRRFGFIMKAAGLTSGDLLTRDFGEMTAVFSHNLGVLTVIGALAFVFRAYGALLGLGWNAAIWGIVLTVLALRGIDGSSMHPALYAAGAALAVLPHLIVEAAAYAIGALAAIFFSRGIVRYGLTDRRLFQVVRACVGLYVTAVLLLLLGAALEQHFVPRVLGWLR